MIEIHEKAATSCEMDYKFFMINIKHKAIEEDFPASNSSTFGPKFEPPTPKIFMHVESFIELDSFIVTHGPGTFVNGKKTLISIN